MYPEKTNLRSDHVAGWKKRLARISTVNRHFKDNGYLGLGKVYHATEG